MKNNLLIIISLFISLFPLTSHASQATSHHIGEVHFELPETWEIKQPIKSKSIYITNNEHIATINIIQKQMYEPITANALQEKRAISHYDGWINILTKPSSEKDKILANVEDAHVAVYVKQFLNKNLTLDEKLVGEYYYVKDSLSVIVSFTTTKSHWKEIQPNIKTFLNSFWIGEGERTSYIPKENVQNQWTQPGNINNNFFIDATPPIFRELALNWELNITQNITKKIQPILYDDHLFVLDESILKKINTKTGLIEWTYSPQFKINPYLSYQSGLLFLLKESPKELCAISSKTGEIIYTIPLSSTESFPSFKTDRLFINNQNKIQAYAIHNGSLLWEKKYQNHVKFGLLNNEKILITFNKSNQFVGLDLNSGNEQWKTKPIKLSHPPSLLKNTLYVQTYSSTNTPLIKAIDLNNGKTKWDYTIPHTQFKFSQEISLSEESVTLTGAYFDPEIKKELLTIFSLNPSNGSLEWEQELDSKLSQRPITTFSNIYIYQHENEKVAAIDALTGEPIPIFLKDSKIKKNQFSKVLVFQSYIFKISGSKSHLTIQCFG